MTYDGERIDRKIVEEALPPRMVHYWPCLGQWVADTEEDESVAMKERRRARMQGLLKGRLTRRAFQMRLEQAEPSGPLQSFFDLS
jgi:hypothetical protein